ncbi:MAG TPA: hydroxymethylglutaryl-CoA lyase [Saprospiraceae bacterium]|nr:hydroxymethylglutaryl-CoA lyase [Saprospiraceae bacterium]
MGGEDLSIIECPRDAMQGITEFIPTYSKVRYINQLLKVGYHTIDFGSFVSPKAIPQMADTAEVLECLDRINSNTKLLAIVANVRGALSAASYEAIDFIGFPFSISETFQIRNTNSTIVEAFEKVKEINEICQKFNKELVIYISMGFGNPYGDVWNAEICFQWVDKIKELGITIIQLSDTVGIANPESISYIFKNLIPTYSDVTFGAHLHTQPHNWEEKIIAAYNYGCRRFDTAIRGYGGCPMAKDSLTGNMPTENLISFTMDRNIPSSLNINEFFNAMAIANEIFPH